MNLRHIARTATKCASSASQLLRNFRTSAHDFTLGMLLNNLATDAGFFCFAKNTRNVTAPLQVFPQSLEGRMAEFPLAGQCPVFHFRQKFGLKPFRLGLLYSRFENLARR